MASKTWLQKTTLFLGIGFLSATVSLAGLAFAAVFFVKQAASRIVIDGDALGKVMQDAGLITMLEGSPEQKLEIITSCSDAPVDAAPYV